MAGITWFLLFVHLMHLTIHRYGKLVVIIHSQAYTLIYSLLVQCQFPFSHVYTLVKLNQGTDRWMHWYGWIRALITAAIVWWNQGTKRCLHWCSWIRALMMNALVRLNQGTDDGCTSVTEIKILTNAALVWLIWALMNGFIVGGCNQDTGRRCTGVWQVLLHSKSTVK